MAFAHLNIHSHYGFDGSIVQIPHLFYQAKKLGINGVALTDFSRMGGVPEFLAISKDYPSVKPVVGCSFQIVDDAAMVAGERPRYVVVLLAKNQTGYHNLLKLSSLACMNGSGGPIPVSRNYLEAYHEGLICLSGGLGGEVAQAFEEQDFYKAREAALWYKDLFGEDFYFEVFLHKNNPRKAVSALDCKAEVDEAIGRLYAKERSLLRRMMDLGEEVGVKLVATNPVHFVEKGDAIAHDARLCILGCHMVSERERPRFTHLEYLRSEKEMRSLFAKCPDAVDNTMEVLSKIEPFDINVARTELPDVSPDPKGELRETAYQGAVLRYGSLGDAVKARIDGELASVAKSGMEAYFLIVKELVDWAREHHVVVSPGRGRAPSSMLCYCLGITDVDPLRHGLLSELFLNPERIIMPDVDLDFSQEGVKAVSEHLAQKYGKDAVSYMITFLPYNLKRAFESVARVYGIPWDDVMTIRRRLDAGFAGGQEYTLSSNPLNEIRASASPEIREVLDCAERLDGAICYVGVHACANLLAKGDLTDKLPMMCGKQRNEKILAPMSQYDGHWVEDAGVLKLDFLGLSSLDLIREVENVVSRKLGVAIDARKAPLDDAAVYALFQAGDTKGVFLFESEGKRGLLSQIRPDRFSDLVALNALYWPQTVERLDLFNELKNGRETMAFDFPEEQEILAETYGLIVYQEQVMLLGQKIAGLTPGLSARFKKSQPFWTPEMYRRLFVDKGLDNGRSREGLERLADRIYQDRDLFYMKSHAVAYAWIAYQTAWLKVHYREDFMEVYRRLIGE